MKQGTLGGFFTKRPRHNSYGESGEGSSQTPITNESIPSVSNVIPQTQCSNDSVDLKDLPKDPTDRQKITSYKASIRDDVRRAYLLQGPCQIRLQSFPRKIIASRERRFVASWYDEFDWLEYSVKEDKTYCLWCYVCGDLMEQRGGRDAFVSQGFNTWSKKEAFRIHVGNVDSLHNKAKEKCELLTYFKSYEFVFYLYMMYDIFNLTSTLSKQLQRKDLDIVEAASMVRATDEALNSLRNTGFERILPKVSSFCQKHQIDTLNMEDLYVGARNRTTSKTNRFHFEYEIFNTVVDMQLNEYRDRFSERSTNLLDYMGALNPCDAFAKFDQAKLLKLSKLYKYDFNDSDIIDLEGQLTIFYHSCINDERFTSLKGISDLSRLMVSTGRHRSYPLVYRLLKLTLTLPVATASVERCFSKMKLLKKDVRNKIGDEFLNNALLCNVEKEALVKVETENVMKLFQKMKM